MSVSMTLSELLCGYAQVPRDCTVRGMSLASGEIRKGDLYVACAGLRRHGVEGIAQALERGAAAIAYESGPQPGPAEVPCIAVPHLSRLVSAIAGRFYRDPSASLPVIGVTGTDGKTSTAHLTAQLLQGLRRRCGLIGTLGAGQLADLHPTGMTTPDAIRLQAELHRLLGQGDAFAVLEVSSHALDQHRCDGVRFDTAVFTTLGRDHLEYHGTEQRYFAAKRRLFAELRPRRAVWNMDDAAARRLEAEWQGEQWTCSLLQDADLRARDLELTERGLAFTWQCGDEEIPVEIPGLYGRFNVTNLLLSSAAVQAQGVPPAQVAAALEHCRSVPGRLERVGEKGAVFLDYAHTEQALAASLDALREHFGVVAHCVFGCGGERDASKRPRMGAVAEAGAKRIIITDDNPRGESPQAITDQIRAGLRHPDRARVVHDRREAIREAIASAAPGEVVLIAGKGHETEQVTARGVRAFSDRTVIEEVLS